MITKNVNLVLPIAGQIRKGLPKTNTSIGKDLDRYFRVRFFLGFEDAQQKFLQAYGTLQPDRIKAMFLTNDISHVWSCFNEAYSASGVMIAQADDNFYISRRDPVTLEYVIRDGRSFNERSGRFDGDPVPWRPGDVISYQANGKNVTLKFKPVGRLRLWLPALAPRFIAIELRTTSFYDKLNIESNLSFIQAIADTFNQGRIAGIPLVIYRRQFDLHYSTDNGARQSKKWLIQIEADEEWVGVAMSKLRMVAGLDGQPANLLPSGPMFVPGDVPDLDIEDIDPPVNEDGFIPDPDVDPAPIPDVPVVKVLPQPHPPSRGNMNLAFAESILVGNRRLGTMSLSELIDLKSSLHANNKRVSPMLISAIDFLINHLQTQA